MYSLPSRFIFVFVVVIMFLFDINTTKSHILYFKKKKKMLTTKETHGLLKK